MKKISVLIPCYNEHDNVVPMSEAVVKIFSEELSSYDYEIIFIDNNSNDGTRELLRSICSVNKKIKAIFNARNFGAMNSQYYGIMQTEGDCTILIYCDFQEPVDMLPVMVHEWEKGAEIVVMQKTQSKENKLMYFIRTCYYRLMKKFSDVEQYEHFDGFGLYDKKFVQLLRDIKDPKPYLRGTVAELGSRIKVITYTQNKRRAGKSSYNFMRLYDVAMTGLTSYTRAGLRAATLLGFITAFFSTFAGIFYLIQKILFWDTFTMGMGGLVTGMFFIGAVILIFLGLMGEYIISINQRLMNRPLVIEEERINFHE